VRGSRAASHSACTSRLIARAQRFRRESTAGQAAESRSAAASSTSKFA
jgi:hypothetical protein